MYENSKTVSMLLDTATNNTKSGAVFTQCMQICSSWNITLRMLQSCCPNSVIILLSFLWLLSVLQPSKQTFELWSYGDQFSIIRSITAYNHYLSVLSSLVHSRFSVVMQHSFHWKQLCSRLLFERHENNFLWCCASLLCLLRGSPANSGLVDFASEKSFPLNFVH